MIVHTKLLAEMIELMASTGEIVLAGWFFWVELTCVLVFGVYWLVRLTQCLGMYDPLFIIPLMQTAFIIFGAVRHTTAAIGLFSALAIIAIAITRRSVALTGAIVIVTIITFPMRIFLFLRIDKRTCYGICIT